MNHTIAAAYATLDPIGDFKEALEQLAREHADLKEKLVRIYHEALGIGNDPSIEHWGSQLHSLRVKVEAFMAELEEHSEWEERNLFPIVAMYTGKDIGPAMVMEQEHYLAVQYVHAYYSSMDGVVFPVASTQAREIITFLLQMYFILTDHFQKEEEWIFPIAELMLRDIELFYS